jgi:hypothetical protein
MRFAFPLLACTLALIPQSASLANDGPAIAADQNPISRGQTVTLRWYFTGKKVLVSGGRFGKGINVTGRTSLTDRPLKTTRYTFEVWYRGLTTAPKTNQKVVKPLHARYSVVVQVESGAAEGLTAYRDRYGWQVRYIAGWKPDGVPLPDPANNALIYFQKEDDSVERLAVSILPASDMSCKDLMQKIQASLYSSYDQVQVLSQKEDSYAGVPAQWCTFTGLDHAHPSTHTQSLVLAFVREGRAYVVSARTQAERYSTRETLLKKMVTSFGFATKQADSSANHS